MVRLKLDPIIDRLHFRGGTAGCSAGIMEAQESRGTIVGLVTDTDGRPREAVRIKALVTEPDGR
jgi:hypothetical protein